MLNKFIVILTLTVGTLSFADEKLHFTGDQAHGLMSQIKASPQKKFVGNSYVLENVTCESATIFVTLTAPQGQIIKNYPLPSTGCSKNESKKDIAMEAFMGSSAHRVWLMTGLISRPIAVGALKFKAASVSCVENSDRCEITK